MLFGKCLWSMKEKFVYEGKPAHGAAFNGINAIKIAIEKYPFLPVYRLLSFSEMHLPISITEKDWILNVKMRQEDLR